MRLSVLLALLPAVLAASAKRDGPAPLYRANRRDVDTLVADEFIVKFKDVAIQSAVHDAMSILDEAPKHVFQKLFRGFSGKISEATLEALRLLPEVDYIEQNALAHTMAYVDQPDAEWGPVRLSSLTTGGSTYTYDDTAGAGTCSYVIDTGVDDTHPEFGGRATQVYSFVAGEETDGNSHGTHCAGIIGSETYGVAKATSIYGIKVLDNAQGSGTYADVIAGMEYVVDDSASRDCPNGVFANMSLGGPKQQSVNDAAAALVSAGVFLAVAAGNDYGADVSGVSPGGEPTVCTVGSTTSSDAVSSFSNVGALVDIFAPGSSILSTIPGGGTGVKSGTSMATPHIVGLAAYLAALEGLSGPDVICARIKELAHEGLLSAVPSGTANLLAFNGNPSAS